jgi:hypothetical protein
VDQKFRTRPVDQYHTQCTSLQPTLNQQSPRLSHSSCLVLPVPVTMALLHPGSVFFDHDPPCGTPSSIIVAASISKGALIHANIAGACDPLVLLEHDVGLIVQCAAECVGRPCEAASAVAALRENGGITEVLELNMEDFGSFRIGDALQIALPRIAAVRSAGRGVLVNCAAGRSRSAVVVLAHLIDDASVPLSEAWIAMRTARPFAYPNLGFVFQLLAFEAVKRGTCSISTDALRRHYEYRRCCERDEDGQEWFNDKV